MSNFHSDLNQEQILSKYLDNIYKGKNIEFTRIFDLDMQHKGIDVIMVIQSDKYFIDEKAQLHYIGKELPTFTFELSYLKNNSIRKGWLFDKEKLTQYYFLITGIFLKKRISILSKPDDIKKVKITSVNRKKLIAYLKSIDLSEEKLLNYNNEIRNKNSFGKNTLSELNNKTEGLIYYSEHYTEKPINLQLRLKFLLETEVAKKFCYV
jgi:CRISPR/Cas system-associated exonuclease Cas4 (RecB family)